MNILILNSNPDRSNQYFERYLELYRVKLNKTGNYVRTFLIRDMEIIDARFNSPVSGTPDTDFYADDFRYISNALGETDLVVIASPLGHGYMSVLAKTIQDRLTRELIPPENPAHGSWNRYFSLKKVPLLAFIFQKEPETDENDLLLNRLAGERLAANLHTMLGFCATMDSDITETVSRTWQSMDYHLHIEQAYNGLISGG